MSHDYMEYTELLGACLGKTEDEIEDACNDNSDIAEQWACDAYDIDLETFGKIAEALVKLTPIVESAIVHTKYHAFIKDEGMVFREVTK